MYISFNGLTSALWTLVKLFIVGVIAITLFKIVWTLLPLLITGGVILLLLKYYRKNTSEI